MAAIDVLNRKLRQLAAQIADQETELGSLRDLRGALSTAILYVPRLSEGGDAASNALLEQALEKLVASLDRVVVPPDPAPPGPPA